ncbi:MAG: DUF1501 domain-containing protein [Bryobacterales bacterium]|nr:DUF1501 domain-containing protein [Bryobacterales bacterium]MDE0625749.1 DUF1501 domain-containing protein [Bryobacterales bacterium]
MRVMELSGSTETRRHFFSAMGLSIGSLALGSMLRREGYAATPETGRRDGVRGPHYSPKAKAVIFLCQAGAPSQLDLFDYKPKLEEFHGTPVPEDLIEGERFAFLSGRPSLLGPQFAFSRHGGTGTQVSEILPHISGIVDETAFLYSLTTDQFNHSPAQLKMFTGHERPGRPSMGAWLTYGIGSENENLPGFVVLSSGRGARCGAACMGPGFLPTVHQGVQFRSGGEPVLFLSNPGGVSRGVRRDSLDAIRDLNAMRHEDVGDAEIETRIASYELAYRMQTSVPELMDISREPAHVLEMYGSEPGKRSFANNCLLARRLVESGVRYVQLMHGEWDHHGGRRTSLPRHLPERCREVDRASAALITDLKNRGMLDETLVVWGGEFGRTPMLQGEPDDPDVGRDHHRTFTMWLAGGGIKAGARLGATDELGYRAVENPVTVHDLQATIMHLMGLDHTRLTFKFQGRDFRLTDVHGEVLEPLLA